MQIAFWSPKSGQAGTTANLIAIACTIALEYRLKILVTHNQFNNTSLEQALIDKSYLNNQLHDEGIDGLNRLMKLNNLDEEQVTRCTTSLLKDRLDLLMGTKISNEAIFLNDFCETYDRILKNVKKYYDLVLIDVTAGKSLYSSHVLEDSDIIVVNLNQNTVLLDDFFKFDYPRIKEKSFYCIGNYDPASKYCIKNLKRYYTIQKSVGVIPYNRGFADSMNEGQCIEFFIKHKNAQRGDPYSYFVHEVNHTVFELLSQIGIDIKARKLGE